jgi:hypothetical protein
LISYPARAVLQTVSLTKNQLLAHDSSPAFTLHNPPRVPSTIPESWPRSPLATHLRECQTRRPIKRLTLVLVSLTIAEAHNLEATSGLCRCACVIQNYSAALETKLRHFAADGRRQNSKRTSDFNSTVTALLEQTTLSSQKQTCPA